MSEGTQAVEIVWLQNIPGQTFCSVCGAAVAVNLHDLHEVWHRRISPNLPAAPPQPADADETGAGDA